MIEPLKKSNAVVMLVFFELMSNVVLPDSHMVVLKKPTAYMLAIGLTTSLVINGNRTVPLQTTYVIATNAIQLCDHDPFKSVLKI